MKVLATASLRYWDGEAISTAPERLEIIVKFKEKGKLFKTKLGETLVTTRDSIFSDISMTYDEFLDEMNHVVSDKEIIEERAETMIKEYFKYEARHVAANVKKQGILDKVDKLNDIKVKVKID
ncbi:hypothetical protein CIL05_07505 [Virgibacillus profundi]|uniref:Uncharacterized protein n=1 Tax=Virgibacillus profundi TaxID=2024555 RepID=A0A2A2IF79_9BACI|nr:hypothetical protein [Virgibacillus profundi]PAV30307.1 hypothetical protein CIL05_07505 [Virgibacillus profundi]PXY54479.1 hypothetical protein CIT14_07590 [Virgibacillus profundi]